MSGLEDLWPGAGEVFIAWRLALGALDAVVVTSEVVTLGLLKHRFT